MKTMKKIKILIWNIEILKSIKDSNALIESSARQIWSSKIDFFMILGAIMETLASENFIENKFSGTSRVDSQIRY